MIWISVCTFLDTCMRWAFSDYFFRMSDWRRKQSCISPASIDTSAGYRLTQLQSPSGECRTCWSSRQPSDAVRDCRTGRCRSHGAWRRHVSFRLTHWWRTADRTTSQPKRHPATGRPSTAEHRQHKQSNGAFRLKNDDMLTSDCHHAIHISFSRVQGTKFFSANRIFVVCLYPCSECMTDRGKI